LATLIILISLARLGDALRLLEVKLTQFWQARIRHFGGYFLLR